MRTPRWLVSFYSIVLILGLFVALPNLFSESQIAAIRHYIPFFPDTRVTLGLDLRGGSSLQLELDSQAMARDRLRSLLDATRSRLRAAHIQAQSTRIIGDDVVAAIPDAAARQKALETLKSLIAPLEAGAFSTPVYNYRLTEEGDTVKMALAEGAMAYYIGNALDQSLEIVRQRVDSVGVSEPSIQRVGNDRLQVQVPGLQDPAQLRTLLGSTAKMSFHLVRNGADFNNPPPGVSILPDYKEGSGDRYPIEDKISLDGAMLTDARAAYEPDTNRPMISFELNSEGAKEFARISRDNIGRAFAIVLDNKVLTAPVIQSVIPNGRGQITGNFTSGEAVTLSALLRAGALPVPLKVIEERSVGPDLGADAIKMGLYTGIIGFILVAAFVFVLYGLWGLIADIALALHTILTFAALSLLGATLTLPGIAGIILGIGIAVDANILINERIREESERGAGALAALDRGFKHAFSTIIDANVTIIIATSLLWYFGTGPVRGFAVTMSLGIIISLFTDVTVVRLIMHYVVRKRKIKVLRIHSFLNIIPQHTNFRFMNARFIGIGVSILLSVASAILFFKPGLNYGIDFKGGIQVEAATAAPADPARLRLVLSRLDLGEIALQNLGSDKAVMVRLQRQNGGEEAQTAAVTRVKEAISRLYPDVRFPRTEVVGPKISGELARSGFLAVILAAIAMTVYIWWRFEWFFAAGAIITLILDTTKLIGVFALFQFDFNLTAIAALMTIVGYSVNDKVVVYDRMRENLRLFRKKPLREIIDMSINQVLVRCIFTSTTTALSMLPMAIWGGEAVHNFALPIVIGVIIATSSSIFIAAPILLFLGDWQAKHRQKKADKAAAAGQHSQGSA